MSFHFRSLRPVLSACAAFSACVFPFYVPLALCIVICLRYRAWEVIGVGLLFDLLWMPMSVPHAFPYGTVCALVLLLIGEPIRRRLISVDDSI